MAAVRCLFGLYRGLSKLIKDYCFVKLADAGFAALATLILYYQECHTYDCRAWLFIAYGALRISLCLLSSHLAWSATHFLECGQSDLVYDGPQVLKLIEPDANSSYIPIAPVQENARPA